MQEEVGAELSVIANTGDDIEALGVHVSPDPDLVTYWLSGEIDEERGWGIRDDSLHRLRAPAAARRAELVRPLRPRPRRLPLPAPVHRGGRAADRRPGADRPRARGRGEGAADVRLAGADQGPHRGRAARPAGVPDRRRRQAGGRSGSSWRGSSEAEPSREVLEALRAAEAIVIGPSNPVISIGPILAVPGMREAIAASPAPVVAVSPYVAGAVVKGPTDRFMEALGRPRTAAGVASLYAGLIDAMVVDEGDPDPPPDEIPTLAAPTLMEGAERPRPARPHRPRLRRAARSALEPLKATAVLPVKRFHAAKQRLAAGHRRRAAARRWRRRWSPTCSRRSAQRARSSARSSSAATRSRRNWRPSAGAEVVPDPEDAGHVEAALAGIARAEADGAELRRPPPRRLPAARPARARHAC